MMIRRTLLLLAATGAMVLPAAAQTWQAATGPTAQLGIQALTCKGEFCLGVACRSGKPELVSMSPGGGPFNGSVSVSVGGVKETVTFAEDPKMMAAFNMLGTRGGISPALLAALGSARDITLSGPTFSDKVTSTFALASYGKLAGRAMKACGGLE